MCLLLSQYGGSLNDVSFFLFSRNLTFPLFVDSDNCLSKKVFGRLVLLDFAITDFTSVTYLRHRL